MRQTRNKQWNESPDKDGNYSWNQAIISVLTDIREELQELNRTLHCQNFLDIPNKLERIKRNTARKRQLKAVGKPKLRVVR